MEYFKMEYFKMEHFEKIKRLKHLKTRNINIMYYQLYNSVYPNVIDAYNYTYDIFSSNIHSLYKKIENRYMQKGEDDNDECDQQEMISIVSSVEHLDD